MSANIKHGASAYAHGLCRCSICRAAATSARRRQRANKAVHTLSESLRPAPKPAEAAPKVVVALPTSPQQGMGINEQSVRAECEQARNADTRQSVVSQAISLARILDNDELMSMWPTTSRQLALLMRELQAKPKKMKTSHLAQVSAMANRRRAI